MEATQGVAERANNGLETMDMEFRIRDIRRRIAEQHTRLGYTQTSRQATKSESDKRNEPNLESTSERERKNAELQDIKAKLLGKR